MMTGEVYKSVTLRNFCEIFGTRISEKLAFHSSKTKNAESKNFSAQQNHKIKKTMPRLPWSDYVTSGQLSHYQ